MTKQIDTMLIDDLMKILNEEWEQGSRATWKDSGEKAHTSRILQSVKRYDLSEGFPITHLREINYRAAIDEILWIYQKMSNNIRDLNSSIWNAWADEEGFIRKAYGHQIAKPTMGFPSQLHYVLNQIKYNPTSRRIMMNMFDAEDQQTKATESLVECAYATHFSVKDGKLHMTLIQRSGDFMVAAHPGGWNTVQYAFLQHALAKECGLEAGIFVHFIQDLHLYDRHEDAAWEMISRYGNTYLLDAIKESFEFPTPRIVIPDKPFFDLTAEDVVIEDYEHLGSIGKLPVAE